MKKEEITAKYHKVGNWRKNEENRKEEIFSNNELSSMKMPIFA